MHLAGGTFIFVGFIVVFFFAFAHSYYTRSGSAINQHPYRDPYGDAPGASRKSSLSGDERASIHFPDGLR